MSPQPHPLFAVILALASAPSHQHEKAAGDAFQTMMTEASMRMHKQMGMPFSGNPDRDFARMMIPHHQGAIDMAVAEVRHGKDERMKRLAQSIIVDQQSEITLMHQYLGDPLPQGSPAPTQPNAVAAPEQ
jgi:uncharacterized protein (DUF305 family)